MTERNELVRALPAIATLGHRRLIDLSHRIDADLPSWPGDNKSFEARTESTIEKDGYFTRSFWMPEHYGTHLDAPAHFVVDGSTVDQIPVERLFGPVAVLDVRDAVLPDRDGAINVDYELTPDRVYRWESTHGPILPGSIVLLRTGWAARWPNAKQYANQDGSGAMHFPGFGVDAVKILLGRGVSGIGIDTMSVDPGCSLQYPVHQLALRAGIYHLENLADLSAMSETGSTLIVAPLHLKGGSGAPCRVFVLLP